MRLGISTNTFFSRLSTESSFDALRQVNVDSCELYLASFSEYEPNFLDSLVLKKGRIYVHAVHPEGSQFEPGLFSTNVRVRTDAENIFKKICYAARILGAKYYTFHGPVRLKPAGEQFDIARIGHRMNQLIDIAQSFGIRIAYENVSYGYGCSPEYFKNLLQYCSNITFALDVKHALLSGTDPLMFLEAMGERTVSVHLCDLKRDNSSALPGEGYYAFDRFIYEIARRLNNPSLFLEADGKDYRDTAHLKKCYDYLNALVMYRR